MKHIHTLKELEKIQDKQYKIARSLNIILIREIITLVNGYALIIGANTPQYIDIYYINDEFYKKHKNYLDMEFL